MTLFVKVRRDEAWRMLALSGAWAAACSTPVVSGSWVEMRESAQEPALSRPAAEPAFRLGGRIHLDAAAVDAAAVEAARGVSFEESHELRRLRLEARGALTRAWALGAQVELADHEVFLHEAWVELPGFPLGRLRAGRHRQPQSLDAHTSSKGVSLLERAAPVEALTSGRDTGLLLFDEWRAGSWAVGAYSPAESIDDDVHTGVLEASGRLTWLPWREDGGELLHLGASLATRESREGLLAFAARPGAHLAPALVDTGDVPADGATTVGLEGLWIGGPWSVQAEWLASRLDLADAARGDARLWGAYVMGTWTLTGERRPYLSSRAGMGKLAPFDTSAHGAWELALRVSHTDLEDEPVSGGELDLVSLGLNWYAREQARVMANVVRAELEDGSTAELFLVRLQLDF